jgi:hypothetical protein
MARYLIYKFLKSRKPLLNKGENKMKAVDITPSSTEILEGSEDYHNFIWRWYEKLTSFCGKNLIPEWEYNDDDIRERFPFH